MARPEMRRGGRERQAEAVAVTTGDRRRAEVLLGELLGTPPVELAPGPAPFALRTSIAWVGRITYGRLDGPSEVSFRVPPTDRVLVAHALSGSFQASVEGGTVSLAPATIGLVDGRGRPFRVRLVGMHALFTVPTDALRSAADPGVTEPPGGVRFLDSRPRGPTATWAWLHTEAYVRRALLLAPDAWAGRDQAAALAHLLAASVLQAFPHEVLPSATAEGGPLSAPVRRAVGLIEDHPADDLDVADLAAAAGLGVRGLQLAFRRQLGTTPLGYLRTVRLRNAHRDLQAGDPATGDRVTAVATRWGFRSRAAFAAAYRATYGCAPSATLRR